MTLVITELSEAGIVMVSDSAISDDDNGTLRVRQTGWRKTLPVPLISAGISYWGYVGKVTTMAFDQWLRRVIEREEYRDLESFADQLVDALNVACHGRALPDGCAVGIHLAGYGEWPDGARRPMFFHVHNGHGALRLIPKNNSEPEGELIRDPSWAPRTRFAKHQDFPSLSKSAEQNLSLLRTGYITRNGDYLFYAVVGGELHAAFQLMNRVSGFSIPRDPESLHSRQGFLRNILEFMIQLYRCSNQPRIVGPPVSSLMIGPDGIRDSQNPNH